MINEIFPEKNINMPDDIYETYLCMVWGCNSMNAIEGSCKRFKADDKLYLIEHADSALKIIKDSENILYRAQQIIWFLLEESGRYKKYEEWEKNRHG